MKPLLLVLLFAVPATASPISYAYTGHKSVAEMEAILMAAPGQRILLFESKAEGQFVASCADGAGFGATIERRCDNMLTIEEFGDLTRVWFTIEGLRRMDGCRVQFDGEQYKMGVNALPLQLDHDTMVPLVVGYETQEDCHPMIRLSFAPPEPPTSVPEPPTGALVGAALVLFYAGHRLLRRA